jgi:hypothetical protein
VCHVLDSTLQRFLISYSEDVMETRMSGNVAVVVGTSVVFMGIFKTTKV